MKYQPTIGLEIHVELKTRTKMFCDCLNVSLRETAELLGTDAESRGKIEIKPNTNICPICLAHPGTLPTINKKAVEAVLKLGLALNSEIPETSKFDRKNYFYPDLPKGYQISQYDKPLALGGTLEFKIQDSKFKIRLRRIHLEEDTARLIHSTEDNHSLVDFNRAGVPLMELVTEPEIKNGKEAVTFAKELQLILRYLDISDADMEKGQLRIEANISLREIAEQHEQDAKLRGKLGVKVEIKNLNSFRAVEEAIDYEIKRQSEILEKGEKVIQETRGWDEFEKKTFSQRLKEEAHDYRYFPEPDLPIVSLRETVEARRLNAETRRNFIDLDGLKAEIPELPQQKRERFMEEYGFNAEQAEILASDPRLSKYFEESVLKLSAEKRGQETIKMLYNYLTSDLFGLMNQKGIGVAELKIAPEHLAHLVFFVIDGKLSSRMAKDALAEMFERGIDPEILIKEKGLVQISDEDSLKKTIQEIIEDNQSAVEDYKKGKENALQFLIGKAMAKLKGKANPDILRKLLSDYLSK